MQCVVTNFVINLPLRSSCELLRIERDGVTTRSAGITYFGTLSRTTLHPRPSKFS